MRFRVRVVGKAADELLPDSENVSLEQIGVEIVLNARDHATKQEADRIGVSSQREERERCCQN
jgi:C4-dicarboxylate-specific signal transduction histidine kinase